MLSPNPTTNESSPAASITPELPPSLPANFTMLDLELLHFWTTQSVQQFVDFENCVELFRTPVVDMALEHAFLMHELLALSALHLSRLRPHKAAIYNQASDNHAATALALFQPEIANLTTKNCHACFAFSTILWVHAWAAQDLSKPSTLFFPPKSGVQGNDSMTIQWVKLHRGSHGISQTLYPVISTGPLEPLFSPWKDLDEDRYDPLLENEKRQLGDLAEAWKNSPSIPDEKKEILDTTLKSLRRIFSMLTYNLNISKLSVVMSWFSIISEEYLQILEQKMPEAMLLVFYYCVPLKKLEETWWMRGKAENLLNTVRTELGGGWERWTRWPIEQVLGDGRGIGPERMLN
jgi:hypothetical protein